MEQLINISDNLPITDNAIAKYIHQTYPAVNKDELKQFISATISRDFLNLAHYWDEQSIEHPDNELLSFKCIAAIGVSLKLKQDKYKNNVLVEYFKL